MAVSGYISTATVRAALQAMLCGVLFALLQAVAWTAQPPADAPNHSNAGRPSTAIGHSKNHPMVSQLESLRTSAQGRRAYAKALETAKNRVRQDYRPHHWEAAPPDTVLPTSANDTRARVLGDIEYGVSDIGSATARLSLWVPPGRAGVQPNLSLQYDSNKGNGIEGVGWTLNGASKITRCMKDGYNDQLAVTPMFWINSDGLCLDGERLVQVGTRMLRAKVRGGGNQAVYRTRHDQFAEIVVDAYDTLGPVSFTVRQKNHLIARYGLDTASRVDVVITTAQGPGSASGPTLLTRPGRLEWLVTRVEDRRGNSITFDYSRTVDPASVEPLLQSIKYTATRSDPTTQRLVSFSYEPRTDISDRYLAGTELVRSVRLASIDMYAPRPIAPRLVRKYKLIYETAPVTSRSRLTTIRECDSDYASVDAGNVPLCRDADFFYQDASEAFDDIDTGLTDLGDPAWLRVGDFNGDGRDDILYTNKEHTKRYFRLSTGVGFGDALPELPETGLVDFDADGHTDTYTNIYPNTTIYESRHSPTGGIDQVPVLSIPGGDRREVLGDNDGNCCLPEKQEPLAEPVDLDGDHRPDLLIHTGDWPWADADNYRDPIGTWAVLWNYGTNTAPYATPLPIEMRPDQMFVDIDGDGLKAVLTVLGNDKTMTALRITPPNKLVSLSTALPSGRGYVQLDVNGDGLVDLLSGNKLWINTGNGFLLRPVSFSLQLRDGPLDGFMGYFTWRLPFDYYADGSQQVLAVALNDGAPTHLAVVSMRMDGSTTSHLLPYLLPGANQAVVVLDANGDGLQDFVAVNNDEHLHLFLRHGMRPDLLVDAEGTLTRSVQFDYRVITADDETTNADCRYPVSCVKSKLWVVKDMLVDTGLGDGSFRTYKHTFLDARFDLLGAGFLGFKTHIVEDAALSNTTTTTFDLSPGEDYRYPGVGHPTAISDETILSSNVKQVRGVTYDNAVKITVPSVAAPNYPFIVYAQSTTTTVRESSSTANLITFNERQTIQIDSFGNPTKVRTEWPGENVSQEATLTYKYEPAKWLVDDASLIIIKGTDSKGAVVTRRTAYDYDGDGLLTNIYDSPWKRNGTGYLPLPPQSDGVRSLFTYVQHTPEGLPELITQTDPTSGETRGLGIVYDPFEAMFPVVTVDSVYHSTIATFEPSLGLPAIVTDVNGIATRYQYDGFGRLRFVHSADGADTTVTYQVPATGPNVLQVVAETAGNGSEAVFIDSARRPVLRQVDRRQDKKIIDSMTKYDQVGRMSQRSRWYFDLGGTPVFTKFGYDNLGRVRQVTLPDGSMYRMDFEGRLAKFQNSTGSQSELAFDTAGNVVRSTLIGGPKLPPQTLVFTYGPFDNLLHVSGTSSYEQDLGSDRLGRIVASRDPDRGVTGTSYDAFGDVIELRRGALWKSGLAFGGDLSTFHYDSAGRLTTIADSDGQTTFEWDKSPHGLGRLSKTVSPDNIASQYEYDALGRLSAKYVEFGNTKFPFVFRYDGFGRVSGLIYPPVSGHNPLAIQASYSNGGQLIGLQQAGGSPLWSLLDNDASERSPVFELGNGVVTKYTTTNEGVLTGIDSTGPEGVAQRIHYGFKFGRLTERQDLLSKSMEHFEYDGLDRLTRWHWDSPLGERTLRWDFDKVGALRKREVEQGPGATTHFDYLTQPIGSHAIQQTDLGLYQYDKLGRQKDGPGRHIDFTSFDLPKAVHLPAGTVTYLYDAMKNRVREQDSTNRANISIDGLFDLQQDGPIRRYVYHVFGADQPVADVAFTKQPGKADIESTTYLHTDFLGSLSALTDSSGKPVGHFIYEPYGKRVDVNDAFTSPTTPNSATHVGFTGQLHESTSSLINFVGRLYDPDTGTFLTPDPYLTDRFNPRARNLYSYVQNDPVNAVDPTGFDGEDPGPGAPIALPEPGTEPPDPIIVLVNQYLLTHDYSESWQTLTDAVDWAQRQMTPSTTTSADGSGLGGSGMSSFGFGGGVGAVSNVQQGPTSHYDAIAPTFSSDDEYPAAKRTYTPAFQARASAIAPAAPFLDYHRLNMGGHIQNLRNLLEQAGIQSQFSTETGELTVNAPYDRVVSALTSLYYSGERAWNPTHHAGGKEFRNWAARGFHFKVAYPPVFGSQPGTTRITDMHIDLNNPLWDPALKEHIGDYFRELP